MDLEVGVTVSQDLIQSSIWKWWEKEREKDRDGKFYEAERETEIKMEKRAETEMEVRAEMLVRERRLQNVLSHAIPAKARDFFSL